MAPLAAEFPSTQIPCFSFLDKLHVCLTFILIFLDGHNWNAWQQRLNNLRPECGVLTSYNLIEIKLISWQDASWVVLELCSCHWHWGDLQSTHKSEQHLSSDQRRIPRNKRARPVLTHTSTERKKKKKKKIWNKPHKSWNKMETHEGGTEMSKLPSRKSQKKMNNGRNAGRAGRGNGPAGQK